MEASFFDFFVVFSLFSFFLLAFLFIFFFFLRFFSFFFSISGRSKVRRVTVGRDIHQPTKVFEFVKLILRP